TYAGFGQNQFDSVCGGLVACQSCNDGADLLVSGEHEECGRATVGLHARDIEVLLRMCQEIGTVRWDGSAAVILGINEWSQLRRCFNNRIEFEADLAQEVGVWAESGGREHSVEGERDRLVGCGDADGEAVRGVVVVDGHRSVDVNASGFDEVAQPGAQCPTSREPILVTTTVDAGGVG